MESINTNMKHVNMDVEPIKEIKDIPINMKVSTITLSTQLPYCKLNLTNIGKYLDIDDVILGIKYNYADVSIMKGMYSTTVYKKAKIKNIDKINKKLFYNQVTIIVNNNGNNVNVKLFNNGSLHLTGCKKVNEGVDVSKIIYSKLKMMKNKIENILLTKDSNGVIVDNDNLIYSYTDNNIIGYIRKLDNEKIYIIDKKELSIDLKTKMFISNKIEKQRSRYIYNFDGEKIGFSKIELLKNRNKFYKNNTNIYFDNENGLIYYNNDLIIGKIIYDVKEDMITNIKKSEDIDIFEISYNCNPFINKDYILDTDNTDFDLNVNCINVYFNINYTINRQRLYDELINMNYICKYKPETYSGIKLLYKKSINNENKNNENKNASKEGICSCSDKCTCINITFLIFQSGNVIVTGFKNMDEIKSITDNFINICKDVKSKIQKRLLENF